MAGLTQNYNETCDPAAGSSGADEATVTLSTTNKGLIIPSRYNQLGTQFFNKPGRKLRITAFGKITTGITPGNITLALLFGTGADANGTSLAASAAVALVASQTNVPWFGEWFVHCRTNGTSGSLFARGFVQFGPAVVSTANGFMMMPASAPAAVGSLDLTGTSIPSLQALRSGSTAETMTVQDYDISPMN